MAKVKKPSGNRSITGKIGIKMPSSRLTDLRKFLSEKEALELKGLRSKRLLTPVEKRRKDVLQAKLARALRKIK